MNREEFIKYIESIGFQSNEHGYYNYKAFKIYYHIEEYEFYNGSEWCAHYYNDLAPELKRLIRSYKLKALLYFNIS